MATKRATASSTPRPPSRARIVDIKSSYGLFINGEFVDGHGKAFKTISPATEEVLAEIAEADEADVDRAVKAARRAYTRTWGRMPGGERAKYLYRIARIIQERGRELAVLESIDNGKPIKESRDVDVPLVAAHFFYYAGWADKLEHAGFGGRPAAARRRRPGHPVELPAADAGVEDRPGAGLRQHRRAQAGRDDAADRAAVRRDLPAGRPAARRRQHRHRRRRDRRARSSRTPTSTRSPSPAPPTVGKAIAEVGRRHATRRSPSSSAARPPTSSSTTPRSTRPSRASSTASSSTRATSAAPARGCSSRSRSPTRCSTALKRRMSTLRVGDPLDKNTDIGAINSAEQLAKIRELSDIGEAEGAERWSPAVRPARSTASGSRRRSSPTSPRPTGSPARRSSARCCRC